MFLFLCFIFCFLMCLVSDAQVRKSWVVSWMASHMWMVRCSSHPATPSANVQVEEWPVFPCALKMSACPAQTAHILKGSKCQESAVRSGCVRPWTTVCNMMFKQVTSFHSYLHIKPNNVARNRICLCLDCNNLEMKNNRSFLYLVLLPCYNDRVRNKLW